MANGYLVTLGPNGEIDVGDGVALTQSTFTIAETIGTGHIAFSGTSSSGSSTATFYRGTDGNIYAGNAFIPSSAPQTSAQVNTFTPSLIPDAMVDGTSGDDLIDGSFIDVDGERITSGDDLIVAGDGNDRIAFSDGADTVFGDAGDDTIEGGGSGSVLEGGDGNDLISVGSDNVTAFGDAGNDTIFGATGNETTHGGDGDDYFFLYDGDDVVFGGTGADTILAQEGADTISGGTGADSLIGGDDGDTFLIENDFGADTIIGSEGTSTGTDFDRIDFSAVTTSVTVTYSGIESGTATNGTDTLDFYQIEALTLTDQADVVNAQNQNQGVQVDAGGGNDSVLGGNVADSILGGAGNDTLSGGEGADTIDGGAGDDIIGGYLDNEGDDLLRGGDGADSIFAGGGDDVVYGDAGSDTLAGGVGNDTLYGGDDGDRFSIGDDHGGEVIFGGEGGTGNDTLSLYNNVQAIGVTVIYSGFEAGTFAFNAGTGSGTFSEIETLWTTDYGDYIDAGSATTGVIIDTRDGADSIIGGAGADWLQGGAGADTIFADGGDDDIILGTGDQAHGGTGDDVFYFYDNQGTSGSATVYGGEGGEDATDTVNGADGDGLQLSWNGIQTVTHNYTITYSGSEQGFVSGGTVGISFFEIEWIETGAGQDIIDASADAAGIRVWAGAGNDTIFGGTGGDTIAGGDGDDLIYGGAGDDFLTTGLGQDTLVGGDGNDTLMNSDGDDSLDGGAGDDSIIATGGRDTLRGGTGADTMAGGDDADTFIIEDDFGNDIITGGEGTSAGGFDDDVIDLSALTRLVTVTYSGPEAGTITDGIHTISFSQIERLILTDQADVVNATANTPGANIDGGGGDDSIEGSTAGNDTLLGGDGNDTLRGWNGSDSLDGGAGNDSLIGDTGNDTLVGGSGNDTIALWIEDDLVEGGDDADLIQVYSFDNDTIFGGEGTTTGIDFDTIDFSALSGPVTVTYTGNEAGTVTNGTRTITFAEIERLILTSQADVVNAGADSVGIVIVAGAGNDSVKGGTGNDSILGGMGNDTLDGDWGDDTLEGGDGADTLRGGGGNDVVSGGGSNDRLEGGAGNDTLIGGDGNDSLFGGSNNDSLEGGAGNDSLDSSFGNDTLRGGSGNDTLVNWSGADLLDGGDDSDTIQIDATGFSGTTVIGGEGGVDNDLLNLGSLTAPVTVTYTDNEGGTISGGGTLSFSEIERLTLSNQNDSVDARSVWNGLIGDQPGVNIDAGGGNDTIFGGRGGDTIQGGAGNDYIDGGYGDDSISGGAGNDTLIATETGNDTIDGGDGDDSIDGGHHDDTLTGGSGADTILGGTGDDLITGGTGSDSLTGGDGNDVFVYASGDGADTITDFNFGNTGALGDQDTANNDFTNLSGFYDRLSELRADFSDDGILNQSNSTTAGGNVDYSDNERMQSGDGITFQDASRSSFRTDNTGVVCFGSGTRILTPSGEVLIENLRAGDLVVTRDNGPQRIAWIGHRHLRRDELALSPKLKPVWISPQLSGADAPLIVSPQHGLVFNFEGEERLIRATHLARTSGGGARIMRGCREITYHHVMFEAHEIIFANGAASESFFPGPWALHALEAEALQEVVSLFPDLTCQSGRGYGLTARSFVPGRQLPDTLRALSSVSA